MPSWMMGAMGDDYVESSLPMRVTYDREVDAAYIKVADVVVDQEATQQVECDPEDSEGTVILDFDNEGRLLGIEVLGASLCLPGDLLIKLGIRNDHS